MKCGKDSSHRHIWIVWSNEITTIKTATFSSLPGLYYLGMGYNNLGELRSDIFTGLDSLGELLDLFGNEITSIQPGTFTNCTNLRSLVLSYNKLENITHDMWRGIRSLKELHLEYAGLRTLRNDMFKYLAPPSNIETCW